MATAKPNPLNRFSELLLKAMAASFNPATDFPPAVDTVEKALAHLIFLVGDLYGSVVYQELPGALMERVADVNIIKAADGTTRAIGRVSIPLDTAYITATSQKLWTFAEGLTADAVTVPAAYKVD